MKRVTLALAAGAALLGLPAAVHAADMTFAVVPKNLNNPFFEMAREGCLKAQEELEGAECLFIGPPEHDAQKQVQTIQDLISRGVDGIAVSPADAPAVGRAVQRAKDAGIPVITWDADLLEKDKELRATYIGTKNYDIGVNLAKIVQELKPDGGTICLQTGGAAAANHNERLQGIRDTLSGEKSDEAPGIRLVGDQGWTEVEGCPLITDDDSARAVSQMADILGKYPDLDAFVSTGAFTQWSDNAYRQVVEQYKDKLDSHELVIAVADTLPMQMQQLKDGLSHGQVGQRPFDMGYKAMYTLKDMAEGREVQDPIYTGLDVCTQENADSCLQQGS